MRVISERSSTMVNTAAIEPTFTSLQDLQERLGLRRSGAADFFGEWVAALSDPVSLDPSLGAVLETLRRRHAYYYQAGLLQEGTVVLSIVAPLLEAVGFHEPPFFVRSEVPVTLAVPDRGQVYRGRIDVLVVQQGLWVLTVEAKNTRFAADFALPQCLAYLAAAQPDPSFGLVTNGTDFLFCKLQEGFYDFSDPFSLLSRQNQLISIVQVLLALKAFFLTTGATLP